MRLVPEGERKRQWPRLATEIFTVPIRDEDWLAYAPIPGVAFCPDSCLLALLQNLQKGELHPSDDPDGSGLAFLRTFRLVVDSEPTGQVRIPSRGPVSDHSLTLVLTQSDREKCSSCHSQGNAPIVAPPGCELMSLDVATQAIDCLLETARDANVDQVELTYDGEAVLADIWQVVDQSLVYAKRRATELQIRVLAYLRTSSSLTGEQTDWAVANLNGASLIISAQSLAAHDGEGIHELLKEWVVPLLDCPKVNNFSLVVRLLVTLEQIPVISKSIEVLCGAYGITTVEVAPAFYMRSGHEKQSPETKEFVEAYRAGQQIASRHGCSLRLVGVQLGSMRNFCGVASGSLTVLPNGAVGQCCERTSLSRPEGARASATILQQGTTSYRLVLERRQQAQAERLIARPYCQSCFAKHTCAGPCSLTSPGEFQGSERCYIIKELIKDQLLANIYAADGLIWQASGQPAGVGTTGEASGSPLKPSDRVRPICLDQLTVAQGRGSPGLFPVVLPPWHAWTTRRGFLGACIKTAVALVLCEASTWAQQIRPPSERIRPPLTTLPKPTVLAGAWVDPLLLSMVGIAAGQNDSIEEGYHLRWFTGERLDFPPEAFPSRIDQVQGFVTASEPEALEFEWPAKGKRVEGDKKNGKQGFNRSVPPGFFLYRRPHYPHFDHTLQLTDEMIRSLSTNGKADSGFSSVKLSLETRSAWKDPKTMKRYRQPGPYEWPIESSSIQLPHWAARESTQVLVVAFRHPSSSKQRRPVHRFELQVSSWSLFGNPRELVLEAYADGDPEPVQTVNLAWEKRGWVRYTATASFVQGHVDLLKVVGWKKHEVTLRFSFMDEDTKIASDEKNPKDGEWVLINSIPFITFFQTWERAKEELFRHQIKNRYLDFSGPRIPGDSSGKLDVKYRPLFRRLQQAFVRLRYAALLNKSFLTQSGGSSLTELRYKPYFFFQFWCMDPVIATLLSQKYADVLGFHNPKPPALGTTYDYMVTTAWQRSPGQRLCYITQKVSLLTTPPMLAAKGLTGTQLDGLSQSRDQVLYRAGINWQPQIAESPRDHYGQYEAPLFDVARGDVPSSLNLLTHYVDANAAHEDDRIVDSPVHAPVSLPYPTTAEDRAQFTPQQLDAVDLQQILQAQDSRATITHAQVIAYRDLLDAPLDEFFRPPEPEFRFNEWLPAPPPREEKTVYYDVRAVDLFGRTSPWHGPIPVAIRHMALPPEPVDLAAFLVKNDNGPSALVVSWRLGSRQLQSGAPVHHFNILWKEYDPRGSIDLPLFSEWKVLKSAIPYRPPTQLTVEEQYPLTGSAITGQILSASASGARLKVSEETALLGDNVRVVTVTTDQCLHGLQPFVDVPARYHNATGLLDTLKFTAGGHTYDVVALEGGETLRVGIPVAIPSGASNGAAPDVAVAFMQTLGSSTQFTLTFQAVRESFAWTQTVNVGHLTDIGATPDLPATGLSTADLAALLKARRTLGLRISAPFEVEVTGREAWFTNGARFEYQHSARTYIAPIVDFTTIAVSPNPVRFGTVRMDPTTHAEAILQLGNGGSKPLIVSGLEMPGGTAAGFSLDGPALPATVLAGAALVVTVRFTPTSAGGAASSMVIMTDAGSLTVSVSGTGVAPGDTAGSVTPPPTMRKYLAELTMAQVILEADAASAVENPAPIFPDALLTGALSAGSSLPCRIRLPPVRRIVSNRLDTDPADAIGYLKASRGGDLSFVVGDGDNQRGIICEVLTRAVALPTDAHRLSFLIRQAQAAPASPIGPGVTQACAFHPIYREEIDLSTVPDDLQPRDSPRIVNIAVSAHRQPLDGPEYPDLEKRGPVSVPVQITLPAVKPTPPRVAALQIPEPRKDPFEVDYTTLPKMLDNRKVVQYKVKLDNSVLMKNAPPSVPATGQLELYRATEDALRLLILDHMKLDLPRDPANDSDFLYFLNLNHDPNFAWERCVTFKTDSQDCEFDLENKSDRYSFAFLVLNAMIPSMRYQAIASRLIRYWDHTAYSLKNAFHPIGKILQVPPHFVDELEGIAAGNVFYAVRTVSNGVQPSDLQLLPFRVVIPDLRPPAAPTVTKSLASDGRAVLRWAPNRERDMYAYEVYRSETVADTASARRMKRVKTLYLPDVPEDQRPADAEFVQHAPLVLVPTKRDLRVKREDVNTLGSIDLLFPIETLGISAEDKVVGIFERDKLPASLKLNSYDLSADSANRWVAGASQVSQNKRVLEGIDLPNKTEVVIVYIDSRGLRALLQSVSYHMLELDGIPIDQRSRINGIYPQLPLMVWGNKVPLLFDSSVHGISTASQIRGIYRTTPGPREPGRDGGYGSTTAFNHWTNVWPSGAVNSTKRLSSDSRTIEGIFLPRGTAVVVEYQHGSGELRTLREVLPASNPSTISGAFSGLLSQPLAGENAANDPPSLVRLAPLNEDTFSALGIKLQPEVERFLSKLTPVRVRFGSGPANFDTGARTYAFVDDEPIQERHQQYTILATRRVRIGPSTGDVALIRSGAA